MALGNRFYDYQKEYKNQMTAAANRAAAAYDEQLKNEISETKEQGRELQRQYKDLYNQTLIQEQINKNQARESLAQLGLSNSGYANALYSGINASADNTMTESRLAEQKSLKALSDAIVSFKKQNEINKANSYQSYMDKADSLAEAAYNKERTKALKTDFSTIGDNNAAFRKLTELGNNYNLTATEINKLLEQAGLTLQDYEFWVNNVMIPVESNPWKKPMIGPLQK